MKSSPCKVGLGCTLTALPSEREPGETRLRSSGVFSTELLPSVQLLLTCPGGDVILSHQIPSVCWRGVTQECVIIVLVAAGAKAASKDVLSDAFPVASGPTNGLCCLCRCSISASISHTVRSSTCTLSIAGFTHPQLIQQNQVKGPSQQHSQPVVAIHPQPYIQRHLHRDL